jgi:lipopolysaccharide/colanic/teichoic acid biosynthesis glycosyltransferase
VGDDGDQAGSIVHVKPLLSKRLQRWIDATVAATGLVILSPLLLGIAAILRCTGEHRVLFMQERVGHQEAPFTLVKFTTMSTAAVDCGTVTRHDDPDVLAVGRVLRRTRLNELPQLWNLLRGDMALVGPRPLPRSSFQHYAPDLRAVIVSMKPGLTGLGSLFFHDEERLPALLGKSNLACYVEDIMPLKGALEEWYAGHRSAWIDVKILAASCLVAVLPSTRSYVTWFDVEPLLRRSALHGYFSRAPLPQWNAVR